MNTRVLSALVMAALSMFFVNDCLADHCDSAFGQAHELFETARSAYKRGDYESAERWYDEAASSYDRVAGMTGCRCPKIAGVAGKNSATSRSDVQLCRSAIAKKEERARTTKEREEKIQGETVSEQPSTPASESKRQQRDPIYDVVTGSPDDISVYTKILMGSISSPPSAGTNRQDNQD